MFARFVLALVLAASPAASAIERGGAARIAGAALDHACAGRDGWSDAAPPAQIFGNVYYVGTCGITVLLVTSPQGHVLIDSGPADAAPLVLANIRALGFDPHDIKLIVGSHEHRDHMGGFAALKAATGAAIAVRDPARMVLESGTVDPADPQAGILSAMAPVTVDRALQDGETVRVGDLALTAIATPGHTTGGTSWSWRSCDGVRCANVAYVDSLTAVSRDGYRFADHPERIAPFRATFERVAAMRCDILLTPHPSVSNLFARLAGHEPLIDRDACARLSLEMARQLHARLAGEKPV